jgi:hypothetical protein
LRELLNILKEVTSVGGEEEKGLGFEVGKFGVEVKLMS